MTEFRDTSRNESDSFQSETTFTDSALKLTLVETFTPMPLKFGLEIEYLFIKPKSIDNVFDPHRLYTRRPTHDGDIPGNIMGDISPQDDSHVLALHQAGFLIKERTGKDLLRFPYPPRGIEYDKWHITYEQFAELKADQHDKLSQWTGGRVTRSTLNEFEFMGQELVSRILDVPDLNTKLAGLGPDMMEVRQFLDALTYKPADGCFFVSEVENAGLHVHIGLPPFQIPNGSGNGVINTSQGFDLKFLQHLAYMTIEYEHIISLLHNPQRRGFYLTKTTNVAESNRYGILGARHTCGIYPLPVLRHIHETIFQQNMTLLGLHQLMCWSPTAPTRSKFVNWTNLTNYNGKRTLEFRQHQGTTNADDVEQWIVFVVSLVRAAERKANQDTPNVSPTSPTFELPSNLQWSMRQGKKYCTRFEGEEIMMEKLFDLLQLKNRQRTYWRNRVSQFRGDQYTKHNWYQSCVSCRLDADDPDLIVITDASVHHVLQAEADVIQGKHDLRELQAQVGADHTDNVNRIATTKRELVAASRELKQSRQRAVSLLNLRRDTLRVRARTGAIAWGANRPYLPESSIDYSSAPHDQNVLQIIRDRVNDPNGMCNLPTLTSYMTPAERNRLATMMHRVHRMYPDYGAQNYRGTQKRRHIIEEARNNPAQNGPEVVDLTRDSSSEEVDDHQHQPQEQREQEVETFDLTLDSSFFSSSSSSSSGHDGRGQARKRMRTQY